MHAWEGGHQDHDAVHIVGVRSAQRCGVLASSRQFPLYRRADNRRVDGLCGTTGEQWSGRDDAHPVAQRFKHLRILTQL